MARPFVFIFSIFIPFSLGLFIPVNVINLEKDKDRWEGITDELVKGGVEMDNIHRIQAIYGKELSNEEVQSNTTMLARIFATRGMIGCYLSHRKCWETISMGTDPCQVVLEDDVMLDEAFYDHLHEAIQGLEACPETKDNWDVLILGGFGSIHPQGQRGMRDVNSLLLGGSRPPRVISATDNLTLHVPRRPFGTQAYVLSQRGATKLVKEAWYAAGHVDCVIWGIQELNIACCDPLLAHQNMSFPSTIGSKSWGPDSWLPDTMLVDQYSKVSVKWALGEPLIRIPIINKVLTIGKAIYLSAAGALVGTIGRKSLPWLFRGQTILTAMLIMLLRLMSKPVPAPKQ
mmetsp:Transcript_6767/g.9879  ORF Transcript_6767/g.9879 Transcript_6767/m.9879 type:complete len:344 (+) Transcript_6767:35-1066(+)